MWHMRRRQMRAARANKCVCVSALIGHWSDIDTHHIALFFPLKGYTAMKYCPLCHGSGQWLP
jgi:hypothetical protein